MVPDQENVGSLLDKIAEYRTGVGMKYLEEAVRRVLEKGEFPAKGLMQLYGCYCQAKLGQFWQIIFPHNC